MYELLWDRADMFVCNRTRCIYFTENKHSEINLTNTTKMNQHIPSLKKNHIPLTYLIFIPSELFKLELTPKWEFTASPATAAIIIILPF